MSKISFSKPMFKDNRFELKAYTGNIFRREIGIIIAQFQPSQLYIEIVIFCVREKYRRKGVGKELFSRLRKFEACKDFKEIVETAIPYDFYDENSVLLDEETLKKVYMSYGLKFDNNDNKGILNFR